MTLLDDNPLSIPWLAPRQNLLAPLQISQQDAAPPAQPQQEAPPWFTPDEVQRWLDPAPHTEYGSVLPIARDTETGDMRLALPGAARAFAQGLYDASRGPATGTMTPEASMALFNLVVPDLLERPTPGVLRSGGTIGEADRVSTRVPTAKAAPGTTPVDPHTTADFRVGIDASKEAQDAYVKNAMNLRDGNYPDLPTKGLRNPDNIVNASISHMVDNLLFLHEQLRQSYGDDMVARSSGWYDGASKIANDLADRNGYTPRQVATVMANLSPQKDWFQNADMGRRLIDITRNQQGQAMTPEMQDWITGYIQRQAAKADTPGKQQELGDLQMSLASLRRGQTLGEINDPDTRALFVRAFDEAHNPRSYPIVTPEGGFGDTMLTNKGEPQKIGWGSFGEIKKALGALDTDDLPTLSRSLGGNHKVRSFYNNIIAPDAPQGDTTIDTHAIAAAHLRPLSGDDDAVKIGLGVSGSSNAATGSRGGYGMYHEAYRQAAERLNLLPRQLQSITWEGVRGLFSPEQKRDTQFYNDNYDIWQAFRDGRMSAEDARAAILAHAGGINPPSWHVPPPDATPPP